MHIDEYKALYKEGYDAKEAGDLNTAFVAFSKCVEASPDTPVGHLALALTINEMAKQMEGLCNKALYHAQECARMDSKNITAWMAMGEVALHANKWNEAIAAYERAIELEPSNGTLWGMLGFAYARNGNIPMARDVCEKAVELDPALGTAHFLLCCFYHEKFFNPEKLAYHGERAFEATKPCKMQLEAMWNAAHGFLTTGNYPKGFTYLEARLLPNSTNIGNVLPNERYPLPLWRGTTDLRLLVQTEQGLGDAFLMMRYLPLIKEQFRCEVTFECHANMLELAQFNYPDIKCVPFGTVDPTTVDQQIPIMSLPLIFKSTRSDIPNKPYIKADPEKVEQWRKKVMRPEMINVGICYAAGRNSWNASNHATSKQKSLTFEQIKPILDTPGFNFVELTYNPEATDGIKDFSDTAAIMSLMDVIISVDTATANLAGAMGVHLWLADRFNYDWRWADMPKPWFPFARVYRQTEMGDWTPVISKIVSDLGKLRDKIAA